MGKPKRVSAANEAGLPTVGGTTGKRKPPRALWQRILLWGMVTVLSLGLIGAGVIAYAYQTIKLPDANADFKTNTTFVYYDDGKTPIGSFQVQNRVTIDYDTMPQYTKDAMVAGREPDLLDRSRYLGHRPVPRRSWPGGHQFGERH